MFTDVVGSAELAASLGDRKWRELLDAHDIAIRRALAAYRGKEIKATGDGFLATFDGPARATRCAVAIRDAAAEVHVNVRGMYTGEIEIRDDDIGGIAVHIAARVVAATQPNEILVSSAIRRRSPHSALRSPTGADHKLKGIPTPWTLFAVES